MKTTRTLGVVLAVGFGAACIPDVTGAKCVTSDTCLDGQACINGLCLKGSAGAGGGGSVGGGTAGGGTGGGVTGGGAGGGGYTGGTLVCKACTGAADTTCGAGSSCRQRLCDAKWGCLPSDAGIDGCATVGGVGCPTVPNMGVCTSDAQCAATSKCLRGRCYQQGCATNADCIIPDLAHKVFVPGVCMTSYVPAPRCFQACVGLADTSCPTGTTCQLNGSSYVCYQPQSCQACNAGTCPTGSKCYFRACDGLPGCFPTADPYCGSIGGQALPKACNYGVCTTTADCGKSSDCIDPTSTANSRCLQRCASNSDCVVSSEFGKASDAGCVDIGVTGSLYCMPSCGGTTDTSTCPVNSTCTAKAICDY